MGVEAMGDMTPEATPLDRIEGRGDSLGRGGKID